MPVAIPPSSLFLRLGMFLVPLITFSLGWGASAFQALEILSSGLPPENPVWTNSWEQLYPHTAGSIAILIICATGFTMYGAHQRKTFLETTSDIGFSLVGKDNVKMFLLSFSGWYVSFLVGLWIAHLLTSYFPRYNVNTESVPAENSIPLFLSAIQAGPTEELALVPLFLLLMPAALPQRCRKWGLGIAIALAIVARVSFHLYYGPSSFVQHSIWAAGVIITWLITRNILGLVLAHSCSNGLIALAVDPSFSWLQWVQFTVFGICLAVLAFASLASFLRTRQPVSRG